MARVFGLEVAHAVRPPQMQCFSVVSGHAHAVFDQAVQLIKKVRVHAYSSRNREIAERWQVVEVAEIDSCHSNSVWDRSQQSASGICDVHGQAEVMRECVGGTERNDS